jgi:hypothetical protein
MCGCTSGMWQLPNPNYVIPNRPKQTPAQRNASRNAAMIARRRRNMLAARKQTRSIGRIAINKRK